MKITLLGTSGGIPITGRAQSGILVETSENKILLDCGMGIPLRSAERGVMAEDIDIVCITHEHLDHIQDLPSLTKASWLRRDAANYKIITPPGLEEKLKKFWRSVDEYERSDLEFEALEPGEELEETASIEAFQTEHTEISQGYKLSIDGKSVVYTGDTEPSRIVTEVSKNVDLLIHELSFLERKEGHTNPQDFISKFSDVKVDRFIMTHFYPEIAERAEEITDKIEKDIGTPTLPADDLQTVYI
ncbi:MAG: ribonuclease Z [Candidatus Thermoplasmatota archaeon]|nr:ribonuclease Z [Candidatus Thermoplasmatota archaeon]